MIKVSPACVFRKMTVLTALILSLIMAAAALFPAPARAVQSTQNITLYPGFNFICIMVTPDRPLSAVLSENKAVSDIYSFNAQAGIFASASAGSLTELAAGRGYIVVNGSVSQYTLLLSGEQPPSAGDITLKKGFNLVGFTKDIPGSYFSGVVEKNAGVAGIYKWNPVSGSFVQVLKDASGAAVKVDSADPSFKSGESYYFNMSSDTVMNYDSGAIVFGGVSPQWRPAVKTIDLGGSVPSLEMVKIPSGSFYMGSPDHELERASWEGPLRLTAIGSDFYIGKYEITRAQWRGVMGSDPSRFRSGDSLPVETVSWNDCQSFISKLNESAAGLGVFRLPTEAEWEYACRAGSGSTYNWGASMDPSNCWYQNNSGGSTNPAGMKAPNPWGLFDMSGNVREWCFDEYIDRPVLPPALSFAASIAGARIARGGDWDSYAGYCRSAARFVFAPDEKLSIIGLRLVLVERADAPVISPAGGKFSAVQQVKISSVTPQVSIIYTLDGSIPSPSNGVQYTAAFTVSSKLTIKAIAVRSGVPDSAVASAAFDVNEKAEIPSFSRLPGTYQDTVPVAISCPTPGAAIKYTLDGSVPSSSNGFDYTAPVLITSTADLKAVAVKPGALDSEVISGRFTFLEKVAAPVITPASGAFAAITEIGVTCATPGAIILYTRDNTEPTLANASVCEGGITIFQAVTIKARAIKTGMADSAVTTAGFTFETTSE